MSEVLAEMANKLDGVHLLTVTDSDCMVLASWESPDNELSPEALGEFIQQIKFMISTFKESARGSSKLDDVVLSASASYLMLKPICNGTCFIVADTARNVSLGSIRNVFKIFAPRLEQSIPGGESQLTAEGTSPTLAQVEPVNRYPQLT
jgi:hypothetical protein